MLKRILTVFSSCIVFLLIALLLAPLFFKNQINARVKDELNARLNARVNYSGVGITIFRDFPNLTFSLQNFSVYTNDSVGSDTIMVIKDLYLTLQLKSVIGGSKYRVLALGVSHPFIDMRRFSNGKGNWDILKPTAITAQGTSARGDDFAFEINNITIKDADIKYTGDAGIVEEFKGLNLKGGVASEQTGYKVLGEASADSFSYKLGSSILVDKAVAKAVLNFTVNQDGDNYKFDSTKIDLDNLNLILNGAMNFKDDTSKFNLVIKSEGRDIAPLVSLIPPLKNLLGTDNKDGSFSLNADILGNYRGDDYPEINANLKLAGGNLHSPFIAPSIGIAAADLQVSKPQGSLDLLVITMKRLDLTAGKSDAKISGKINGLHAYFVQQGDLKIALNVRSNILDLNELIKSPNPSANAVPDKNVAVLPNEKPKEAGINKLQGAVIMNADMRADKIIYQEISAENVSGNVQNENHVFEISNVSLSAMGGKANIPQIKYDSRTAVPQLSYSYTISNFDIRKTFKAISAMQKITPVGEYMQGQFSSTMNCKANVKPNMSLDYNSMEGQGNIQFTDTKISEVPVLVEIANMAKVEGLKNLETKNARANYKIANGRVIIEPTDIIFTNGYGIAVKGSHGFDQSIDYDLHLTVPTKEFGNTARLAQNLLSSIPGLNISIPQKMDFSFKINGTTAKPRVQLSGVGGGK